MDKNVVIIDNFYDNVDQVREYALGLEYATEGNYPGYRSGPENDNQHAYLKTFFEGIMSKKITFWPKEYNTAYQITTKDSKTWIHHDQTKWAAVLYLTPNAPVEAGTGIYRHKPTNIYNWDGVENSVSDFNNSDFLGDASTRVIINSARGEIVNENCILDSDILYLSDVFKGEPSPNIELISKCFIATPHIAGYSIEAKHNGTIMILKNFCETRNLDNDLMDLSKVMEIRNLQPLEDDYISVSYTHLRAHET